jgi:hypothetical protein
MGMAIALFLQYLPQLIQAAKSVPDVVDYIKKTHEHLKQSEEWTEEQEAQFDRHLEEVTSQPWWQPEDNQNEG